MDKPKILLWDLETAGVNSLQADLSVIICFGFKWLGDAKAQCWTINQFPKWYSRRKGGLNDKPFLRAILTIMESADITVAHYGDRFDKVFLAGRCIIHGLTPPPPTKMRDTWYIAYKNLKMSSNRLSHLADILGLNEKKLRKDVPEHWPGWWMRALAGDPKAIAAMAEYCRQDVETLEQVYLRLRPYDTAHPRVMANRDECAVCGGAIHYHGFAYIGQNRYKRWQCIECGRWDRSTTKEKDGPAKG